MHQQAGFAVDNDLRAAIVEAGKAGLCPIHRLEINEPKPFLPARHDQGVGSLIELVKKFLRYCIGHQHCVPDSLLPCQGGKRSTVIAWSDKQELHVGERCP
jgi:hypothetical protein